MIQEIIDHGNLHGIAWDSDYPIRFVYNDAIIDLRPDDITNEHIQWFYYNYTSNVLDYTLCLLTKIYSERSKNFVPFKFGK